MSYEFFIGLRYLRAKREQTFISANTFISVAGIFLGVAALIIVLSVMNGFEIELRDKILGVNSHIVLMEYSGGMKDYKQVMEDLKSVDGVVASTPFIYGQAMLKNKGNVTGVVLRGMSTETSADVINLGKMVEGDIDFLSGGGNDTALTGVVIGKELAQNLGLLLFDTVEILLPMGIATPMGIVPRIKKFSVVGIFESGSYEYDSSLVFMSLETCKKFLGTKDTVTGIEIKVDDIYGAGRIAKSIEGELGYPYWARSWMEMNKNLFSALKLERRVMFIILSLIVIVAAFNIITTLIMTVMEKAKDIAILKSMGATARGIMKIFMIEGVVIGAIGTILGSITGISVALNLEWISRAVEKVFDFKILPKGVYYLNDIPSQVNCGEVVIIVIAAMFISFLAAIYPSWRASRLDPAEVLRYE
ncbi:MAG: lipoprotein-releasing ABC transporter permease subunit [Thermodesulfobacteriota bacterium]|nr:lipoprotein-releasing ABC transporter permease subunit [Thermodesulfobacteriota bacterium]